MTRLVQHVTAADLVYREILLRITTQVLTAGERLPEASLAAEMGVSRTPVREALRRLAQEGVVVLVPGGGACLAAPSLKEMADTMEVRVHLERLVIRKLSGTITPLQICRLEETIQEQRAADLDISSLIRQDCLFHHLLAESTHNEALTDSLDALLARSMAFRILFAGREDYDNHLILEEHTRILDALKRRDTELAEKYLEFHLDLALAEFSRSGESTGTPPQKVSHAAQRRGADENPAHEPFVEKDPVSPKKRRSSRSTPAGKRFGNRDKEAHFHG